MNIPTKLYQPLFISFRQNSRDMVVNLGLYLSEEHAVIVLHDYLVLHSLIDEAADPQLLKTFGYLECYCAIGHVEFYSVSDNINGWDMRIDVLDISMSNEHQEVSR